MPQIQILSSHCCHIGPKIGNFGHLFNDMSSNRYGICCLTVVSQCLYFVGVYLSSMQFSQRVVQVSRFWLRCLHSGVKEFIKRYVICEIQIIQCFCEGPLMLDCVLNAFSTTTQSIPRQKRKEEDMHHCLTPADIKCERSVVFAIASLFLRPWRHVPIGQWSKHLRHY